METVETTKDVVTAALYAFAIGAIALEMSFGAKLRTLLGPPGAHG